MADIMIPILMIIIALLVIEVFESPLFILLIGLVFMPITLLFFNVASNYDTLFGAPLGSFAHSVTYQWMLSGVMACIPIAASLRMIYLGKGWGQAVTDKS